MKFYFVYGCIIDRRSLVACNVFAASQCLYQTGVELPALTLVGGGAALKVGFEGNDLKVVERVAHYLPQGVFWSAHDRHWKEAKPWNVENGSGTCCQLPWEVLVLRARYWHRLPGQYFMDVLEAFLRVNEFSSVPSFETFIRRM